MGESTEDPANWGGHTATGYKWLSKVEDGMKKQSAFQKKYDGGQYHNVFFVIPGLTYGGHAWFPSGRTSGTFSVERGDSAMWGTFAHEVGHNWGLGHANGFDPGSGLGHEYLGLAIMGSARGQHNLRDFNAPMRYALGWIGMDQVCQFPNTQAAHIWALNEGPKQDGNNSCLVMTIPIVNVTTIYVSFRTAELENPYGITCNAAFMGEQGTGRVLTLANRVHIHSRLNAGTSPSALLSTLDEHETYKVTEVEVSFGKPRLPGEPPGPGDTKVTKHAHIYVCEMGAQKVLVAVSETSAEDARQNCPLQQMPPDTQQTQKCPHRGMPPQVPLILASACVALGCCCLVAMWALVRQVRDGSKAQQHEEASLLSNQPS